jgi:hypothetical protein
MAYIINKFSGDKLVTLQDGTIDTSTSVSLVGRNYVGYGEIQNENFLFLLENFANDAPPSRPLPGQIWFNTENNSANVFDGTAWSPIGSATVSSTEPENKTLGSLWLKTTNNTLQLWSGTEWLAIGPESLEGFGLTRAIASTLQDDLGTTRPVVIIKTDGQTVAIFSSSTFNLNPSSYITDFSAIITAGINLPSSYRVTGSITGNAGSADRFSTARLINGVPFDGQTNVIIKSSTTNRLLKGDYVLGSNFDGSAEVTWAVDATPSNVIGKVVARNSEGGFSAGTITANFVGSLTGNVNVSTGTSYFNTIQANTFIGSSLTGNAFSATKLETPRKINSVTFDGSQDITISAAANTLTGESLNSTVTISSLVQVGTLLNLNVNRSGITIGNTDQFKLTVDATSNQSTITTNNVGLNIRIEDTEQSDGKADFSFISTNASINQGGDGRPTFIGDSGNLCNIGLPTKRFNKIFGVTFDGVATTAQYADLAENYVSDAIYESGTVLEFGGEFEVTLAEDVTPRIAGVVTTNPAYLMNSKCIGNNVVAIALQGRVPCKVKGEIRKGDMLVSAGNGYAKTAVLPQVGTIIGKSLENFSGVEGIIEVAVGRP